MLYSILTCFLTGTESVSLRPQPASVIETTESERLFSPVRKELPNLVFSADVEREETIRP